MERLSLEASRLKPIVRSLPAAFAWNREAETGKRLIQGTPFYGNGS
jgi:hypothetical protein